MRKLLGLLLLVLALWTARVGLDKVEKSIRPGVALSMQGNVAERAASYGILGVAMVFLVGGIYSLDKKN